MRIYLLFLNIKYELILHNHFVTLIRFGLNLEKVKNESFYFKLNPMEITIQGKLRQLYNYCTLGFLHN